VVAVAEGNGPVNALDRALRGYLPAEQGLATAKIKVCLHEVAQALPALWPDSTALDPARAVRCAEIMEPSWNLPARISRW
jgi:hypothetical protein